MEQCALLHNLIDIELDHLTCIFISSILCKNNILVITLAYLSCDISLQANFTISCPEAIQSAAQPYTNLNLLLRRSKDSSVVEHWTCDQKVVGLSPSRNSGRFFFSRVNFLCCLLFWYPFHPHVTSKDKSSQCCGQ